jgi:hypothetical protein
MSIRFDLHQLRARFERLGRPDVVVSFERQPYRWMLVRYVILLTLVGYAYFLEGLLIHVLGPFGVTGVVLTFAAPLPVVAWLAHRERLRTRLRRESAP